MKAAALGRSWITLRRIGAPLAVVELCRWRIRRSWMVRGASVTAWLVALAGTWALVRANEDIDVLLRHSIGALAWLGLGPVGLALANDPEGRDRIDGICDLLALRGIDFEALRRARVIAALLEAVRVMSLPGLLLSGAVFYHGVSGRSVRLVAGMLGACLSIGAVVGLVASVCGHLAGRRGVGWLAALVIVPWFLVDAFGVGVAIPTLIDAWIGRLLRVP
jgi:hypothetical protein